MVPNASGPRAIDGPWSLRAPEGLGLSAKARQESEGQCQTEETERGWRKTPEARESGRAREGGRGEREEGSRADPQGRGGYRQGCASPL